MKKIITSIALAGVLATTGAALADNQADLVTPPPPRARRSMAGRSAVRRSALLAAHLSAARSARSSAALRVRSAAARSVP
ncbi:MAG: hypothetical protein R3D02_02700 [Hyphomicrobiales bacterium]